LNFLSLIVAKSADWYAQWVQLNTWLQSLYDNFVGNATTSITSRTPGSGSFQFDLLPATREYPLNAVIRAVSRGDSTHYIQGYITASAAGSATLTATAWNGGSAKTDWDIGPVLILSRSPRGTVAKSSAYQLVDGDRDKFFVVSNTNQQTMPLVAGLPDGWSVGFRHDGSGTTTIARHASETSTNGYIDGAASLALTDGQSVELIKQGTIWKITSSHGLGITLAQTQAQAIGLILAL